AFRTSAEDWARRILLPDGLFICGSDAARTTETRYTVYQREGHALSPREFAFSLDNLRPFTVNPMFSLYDDDRETLLLSTFAGILRRDVAFRRAYDARVDELLAEHAIWIRDGDGFLRAASSQRPSSEWASSRESINRQLHDEGFVRDAVAVLNRSGFRAWENVVGHIAVDPNTIVGF